MASRTLIRKQSTAPALANRMPKPGFSPEPASELNTNRPESGSVSYRFGDVSRFAAGENRPSAPPGAARLPWPLQAKLEVGAVNDPLEREADQVAEQVMRVPAAAAVSGAGSGEIAQRKCEACAQMEEQHTVQRKCDSCAEEEKKKKDNEESHEKLSRKESSGAAALDGTSAPAIVSEVLRSSGQPLDAATRAFFEPRFGYDFSQVRMHADPTAAESARAVHALAYAAGPNIAFGGGRYQPGTGEGRRLLAHELTHVVQQGHARAVPGSGGVSLAARRATPVIQRDTPSGQVAPTQQTSPTGSTGQIGPLSVTKQYTLEGASRLEVTQALTDFLYKAQAAQGGQTLHITDSVRWAVRKLFQGDPIGSAQIEAFLGGAALPGAAPEFAAAVTKLLPDIIPRSRMAHLAIQSPKDSSDTSPKSIGDAAGHAVVDSTVAPIVKKLPIPKSWQDKIIDGARGAVADGMLGILDQAMSGSPLSATDKSAIHSAVEAAIKQKAGTPMDRKQEGAGSPYAPVQPPSGAPPFSSTKAPGEHTFNLPKIPWDFPTPAIPKPNLPQPPLASDAQAVDKIIQALDDSSLVPGAAKGTADAANYAGAKELARDVANLLAAADKKKQYTVELTIGMNYRHVDDLGAIFDKISDIVRQIAGALPGGAANVGEVIISPARADKNDSFPARRIVKLRGGD